MTAKPTSADFEIVARAVRNLSPLSDADLDLMFPLLRARELKRGELLLSAGELARTAAIVVRGLLREYFVMRNGTERTKAFVTEGEPTGSLADLLSDRPSRAFILADEPTRLCVVDFVELQKLGLRSAAWQRYDLAVMRRLLLLKAEREYELMGLDAAQRYEVFKRRYPKLEARVAARHVASYIAVTPVHLSRLRRAARG